MNRNFNTATLDDPVFRRQSPEARLLYFTLYNHPKNHYCGLFQISAESMALDVGLPLERTTEALAELVRNQYVITDPAWELVWLPEMRKVMGDNIKPGQQIWNGCKKYLLGLRPSPLIARLAETLDIPYGLEPLAEGLRRVGQPSNRPSTGPSNTVSDLETVSVPVPEPPAREAADAAAQPFKPLPLWQALVTHAGAKLRLDRKSTDTAAGIPYTDFSNFTHAATDLAKREPPYALAHYELAGDWIAAGGLDWHAKNNTPPWKRVCERLEQVLSAAEEWDRSGRKAINGERAPPPDQAWRNPKIGERRDNTADLMAWANQRKSTTFSEE